jgi:hypothetical protein
VGNILGIVDQFIRDQYQRRPTWAETRTPSDSTLVPLVS